VWKRTKNSVPTSNLQAASLNFDTPLHASEQLGNTYVKCFRDFKDWLVTKPTFAQATDLSMAATSPDSVDLNGLSHLDSLALSATSDVGTTYDSVKTLWRQSCTQQPVQSDAPKGYEPGSDDSSIDIFQLKQDKALNAELDPERSSVDRDQFENAIAKEDQATMQPGEEYREEYSSM